MIILQVAHGAHAELVTLTQEHHRALMPDAQWCFVLNNLHPLYRPHMHGGWNKLLWLIDVAAMEPDGAEILCIDADVMIQKPFAFTDALPVEYEAAGVKNTYSAFNTGVTFWRNSKRTQSAMRAAWAAGQGRGRAVGEQTYLSAEMRKLKALTLSQDWNKYKNSSGAGGKDPIIQAWHGAGVEGAKRGINRMAEHAEAQSK